MIRHKLGKMNLSGNRQDRLSTLHTENIKGFEYIEGVLSVAVVNALTDAEQDTLKNDVQTLPNTPYGAAKDKEDFKTNPFLKKSLQDVETFIDGLNIADPIAKNAIKRLGVAVAYILKTSGHNQ